MTVVAFIILLILVDLQLTYSNLAFYFEMFNLI